MVDSPSLRSRVVEPALLRESSMSLSHLVRLVRLVPLGAAMLLLGTIATACPGPEYPKCESDDHCKKTKDGGAIDEYCLFGQCQECAKDAHCGAGRECVKGRCEQTCASDDQCGEGSVCNDRRCVTAECRSDDACGAGGSCQAGRCQRAGTTAGGATGGTSAPTDEGVVCERHNARVQFDFNTSDLRPDGRAVLDTLAKCMTKSGDWKITVEGHCDDRGTPEYNLSLGESRAKSVKKYLTALGVDDQRVRVVTYGEEKPLDSSQTEDAWAKNRRGEILFH
ncbi:MAG: OmpA family protein [Deltaproteobacteria bacterium]|nr:OmpA family protein [Deltaproteobacteria bacterium]